jgi:hypothetical protein
LPKGGGFVALGKPVTSPPDGQIVAETEAYVIYEYPALPAVDGIMFSNGEGRIEFLGAEGWAETAVSAGSTQAVSAGSTQAVSPSSLSLTTTWLKQSPPEPIKIFVHLVAPDGSLTAQWDGLSAPWQGWRHGDWFRQNHQLTIPEGVTAGVYELRAGLYHPETGERWTLPDGADHIVLGEVNIE